MMALTGIVFAVAFVVVQFSALAYSPRLVILLASSPTLFHTLGIYSLVALIWTDRGGSGSVPLFSYLLVAILLIISMLAFARLIQSLNNLQLHNVLQAIGARGRAVIRAMFPIIVDRRGDVGANGTAVAADLGPVTQTLTYSGDPRVIARVDISTLVRLAQSIDAVITHECGGRRDVGGRCRRSARPRSHPEIARQGAGACYSARNIANLRAGSEICYSPAGGHRDPGVVACDQ